MSPNSCSYDHLDLATVTSIYQKEKENIHIFVPLGTHTITCSWAHESIWSCTDALYLKVMSPCWCRKGFLKIKSRSAIGGRNTISLSFSPVNGTMIRKFFALLARLLNTTQVKLFTTAPVESTDCAFRSVGSGHKHEPLGILVYEEFLQRHCCISE